MERGRRLGFLQTQRDLDWLDEAIAWQWEMPTRAGPFWRRRGVRHLRALGTLMQAYFFIDIRTPDDWRKLWRLEWLAYAIRRGWC